MPTTRSDSYIVRVYRRSAGDAPQFVGVVERVRTGRRSPFHNITELWDVLALRRSRLLMRGGWTMRRLFPSLFMLLLIAGCSLMAISPAPKVAKANGTELAYVEVGQ